MSNDKKQKLYQDFQVAFHLEKLGEMALDQYTNLKEGWLDICVLSILKCKSFD